MELAGFVPARARQVAVTGSLALLLGSACAAIEASRQEPGVLAKGVFTPTRAAAKQYGPDPTRSCPPAGPIQRVSDDLADLAKSGGKPRPETDGRLCAIADTFLGWEEAEVPPESVVAFVAWHFGVPAPALRVVAAVIETEDSSVIADRLASTAGTFAANAMQPRFGLATQRLKKGTTKVVLVLQDATVEIDPLPRRLELGGQATLSGRVLGDLDNPKVLVSDAAGKLESPPPQPGKAFKVGLRCGSRPGQLVVEIRAERSGVAATAANFPVGCGRDLPAALAIPPDEKGALNVAQKERQLLNLINAERLSAGLPAIAWDDTVARVARAASESFRASQGTSSFDVVARLKQAGVPSPLVLESPAVARSPEEAQTRILASPVNRSNLLHPEATHGGAGIAVSPGPEGRSVVYVTELLVKELPAVDVATLRAKLQAAVARKRMDARAPAVTSDATLDAVAQSYAKELAASGGALAKERADAIVAPLYRSFRAVNLTAGAKAAPLEFAEEPGAVASGKLIGVGVAQGMNPVLGKNAVYVAIIVGTRR